MPKVKAELYYKEVKGQVEATGPLYRVFTHTGQLEKKDALVRREDVLKKLEHSTSTAHTHTQHRVN